MTNKQGASRRRREATHQHGFTLNSRPGHPSASSSGRRYNYGDRSVKRDKVMAALLLAGILATVATVVLLGSPLLGVIIYSLSGGALILGAGLSLVPAFRFSDGDS